MFLMTSVTFRRYGSERANSAGLEDSCKAACLDGFAKLDRHIWL
jgi:hypothetical protein